MTRIERAFSRPGGKALIPFLMGGDPNFDLSLRLFRTVLDAGADMVEIGIPYSDPLADGPVIQGAAVRALSAGFTLPRAFELTAKLRRHTDKALVLFTYVNPLLQYTPERFFGDAKAAGADGVIVPDLPHEESDPIRREADAHGIALVPLVAPTSDEARVAAICTAARGFVYCVSSLGVTGERSRFSERLTELVALARARSGLPVAVGFGVSTPQQARDIASFADGVIVGSACIRRLEEAWRDQGTHGEDAVIQTLRGFTASLAEAIH
jgi:tryptophan synthase alpha chain